MRCFLDSQILAALITIVAGGLFGMIKYYAGQSHRKFEEMHIYFSSEINESKALIRELESRIRSAHLSRNAEMAERINRIESNCMTKDVCTARHESVIKKLDDLEQNIKAILKVITDMQLNIGEIQGRMKK